MRSILRCVFTSTCCAPSVRTRRSSATRRGTKFSRYCVYSANPVGRLVLHLCDYRDDERQRLSDFTCTALQLANFWQDVSRDLEKGRIYIPLEELSKHGLTEEDIVSRRFDSRYVALMKSLIARTRELFDAGMPLTQRVDSGLRTDIELFSRGGIAILDAIEASGYNTLSHRPSLSKWTKVRLLGRALGSRAFARKSNSESDRPAATVVLPTQDAPAVSESVLAMPREPQSVAASYAECNRIARASRSSFYLAFFGLRKEKRNALCALYAFMRLVDNVSDEPGDVESKRLGLARWRALLDEAAAGRTEGHAILPALADTITSLRDSHALLSRSDSRRGNGPDGGVLCYIRPSLGILLPRGGHGRTYMPARFRIPRPAGAGSCRAPGPRVSAHEYYSRRAGGSSKWAASTCRSKISRDSAFAKWICAVR